MLKLAQYLNLLSSENLNTSDRQSLSDLKKRVSNGENLFERATTTQRQAWRAEFDAWSRTEELKAWYGSPEGDSVFQGTSISSLTIPCELENPLQLNSIEDLENAVADEYLRLHHENKSVVRSTTMDNVDKWLKEGVFYGVVLGSKLVSQAFQLAVPKDDVLCKVGDEMIDPHEILSYPADVRTAYFKAVLPKISCFEGMDLSQQELEESLVLSDISKPKITSYKDKLILAPVRCNELCALISRRVTKKIAEKSKGEVTPRSLMVTIYDSDTPYTYHQLAGYNGHPLAPTLPGLTVLGTSGGVDAFRWLYAYRVSLISQKIMKSSLFSEAKRCFVPFVFFGVLVERDADILLNLNELSNLRYRGQLSPYLEYCALLSKLQKFVTTEAPKDFKHGRFE